MRVRFLILFTLFSLAKSDPFYAFDALKDFSSELSGSILAYLARLANNMVRLYEKYILKVDEFVWETTDKPRKEYDFIIVGAGSAGSVVAARLSEIYDWTILCLEAGQPETELVDVPILAVSFQGGVYDWGYTSETQTNALFGLVDNKMPFPRGKAVGGTSVLNYMIYSRGTKEDYDELEKLGNKGWSYNDVLPYFKKSEGAGDLYKAEWKYHNRDGPLSVEDTHQSGIVKAMINGGAEIGLPVIDYNAPVQKYGVSPTQSTTKKGRRLSTGRAFLAKASQRENLDLVVEAFVTKILIDDKTKEAYGVTFEKDGRTHNVLARKEVILCAGAVNSPQLLMLSGVGPKNHLKDLNIKVIKDLPGVGHNLRDHLCFYGMNYKLFFDWDQTTIGYLSSIPDFVVKGKGPFTTLGGVEGVGFYRTNVSSYVPVSPDIEWIFVRGHIGSDHEIFSKNAFRIKDDLYDYTFGPLQDEPVWCVGQVLLHPISVGKIKLKTNDPHDAPLIYANYYSDKDNLDIKRMIEGIRYIRQLEKTEAFQRFGAKLHQIPIYGCHNLVFESDEYWECALRTISVTLYHPMGTCKMGPKTDPMAVVNNKLQVYGIKKLRVTDASIFTFVSGHTNAPSIMAGEKVADMIKNYHL